jgi:hypothetical protein
MNDALDPLEAELQDLVPRQPSSGLRRRIGDGLARLMPPRCDRKWRSVRWGAAVAGGAVAACVVVALLLRQEGDWPIEPDGHIESSPWALANPFDETLPSLWTYRRALAAPPGELDALLDKHVGAAQEGDDAPWHLRAFIRLDHSSGALSGEL